MMLPTATWHPEPPGDERYGTAALSVDHTVSRPLRDAGRMRWPGVLGTGGSTEVSPRIRARIAGALYVLEGLTSVFGQLFVPSRLRLWREARAVPLSLRTTNHDDHARILAAISAGDASAASHAATEHLLTVFDAAMQATPARAPVGSAAGGSEDNTDDVAVPKMLALVH